MFSHSKYLNFKRVAKISSVACFAAVLGGFVVGAPRISFAEDSILQPEAEWRVAPLRALRVGKGDLPQCAMGASYDGFLRVEFLADKHGLKTIGLNITKTNFESGKRLISKFVVPPAYNLAIAGKAIGRHALVYDLSGGDAGLFDALAQGKVLFVEFDRETIYPLSLDGFRSGLIRLQQCAGVDSEFILSENPEDEKKSKPEVEMKPMEIAEKDVQPVAAQLPKMDEGAPKEVEEDVAVAEEMPLPEWKSTSASDGGPVDITARLPESASNDVVTVDVEAEAVPTNANDPVVEAQEPFLEVLDSQIQNVEPDVTKPASAPEMIAAEPMPMPEPAPVTKCEPVSDSAPKCECHSLPAAEQDSGEKEKSAELLDENRKVAVTDVEGVVLDKAPEALAPDASATPTLPPSPARDPKLTYIGEIVWHARHGVSLREVLARWSNTAGVGFVWDSAHEYLLVRDVSLTSSYAGALEVLLSQYVRKTPRPQGKLHVDPSTGERILVVEDSVAINQ